MQYDAAVPPHRDDRGLLAVAVGDGRFLIALTGIALALSGAFAILQSVSGQLLPQDSHAIGMGYLWLAAFPMQSRTAWAWWALAFSGGIGFLAFLTYLGQGYLDSWHGVATLFLLPVFLLGLWRSRPEVLSLRSAWREKAHRDSSWARWGRILLGVCALGIILAGATIAVFGMTRIFVPSDLRFIGLDVGFLRHISPSLIPVISHDRSGFGGGLCSIGCLLIFMARCAELNRSFVEIVGLMGCAGFGGSIGVHFVVGYVDFFHLLPAFLGSFLFIVAETMLWVGWRQMRPQARNNRAEEDMARAAQ